jgi:hypothetical protein
VPNEDVPMAEQADNITITFNEPLAPIDLSQIRLQVLGFKGEEAPLNAGLFPDVPTATSLSPDLVTLIIDIDPAHDPNTPLAPGMVFAVTGFEALLSAKGQPFNSLTPNNFLPLIGTDRVLRFTTQAGASLLAFSAAPAQVPNTAQNSAPSLTSSATLDIDFSAQAPLGAHAFLVYASPGGPGLDALLLCKVFETGFANNPPTVLSIPLNTIAPALRLCNQPLPNTQWDNGLMIDVAVAAVNGDGQVGPRSPVLTAQDNVPPRIISVAGGMGPPWNAGQPAGNFQIRIRFSEEMGETALTDLSNYTVSSVDADRYVVTNVTLVPVSNPLSIVLSFTLTSGAVSDGDAIALGPAIVDEAGNPLDSDADTLQVQGTVIIIR